MKTIDLGSRRELFTSHYMVETLIDAALHLHEPVRKENIFQINEPLDNAGTGCFNLVHVDGRFLLYYRGYHPISENLPDGQRWGTEGWEETQTTNLLVSNDGIHFERPNLGLVEAHGSMNNNILFRGPEAHNFCVFVDENSSVPPEQRFKAIGGEGGHKILSNPDGRYLYGFSSPDGIKWRPIQEGPLDITGSFDSVNVPFWDNYMGCYRIFSRYLETTEDGIGFRAIQSCSSEDFIHWTHPKHHVYDDGIPLQHFYTNATMPCPGAEHILLSFPMRFVPERTKEVTGMDYPGEGVSDAVFMTSRDGVHWDRTFLDAWLRPGLDERNWSHRSQTPAVGLFPTAPNEWSMYVAEHYGWNTNALRRLTVRPHGFASVRANYQGGELVTKPFTFSGSKLYLNYSTSAVGSVSVEIQDLEGRPLEGFAMLDIDPLFGDNLDFPVVWKSAGDLSRLNDTPVRLRFLLSDADLYSIRFGDV